MTTSWAYLLQGQVVAALRANMGGALLASLACLGAPWALLQAVRGKRIGPIWQSRLAVWSLLGLILFVMCEWTIRVLMMP